MSTDDWKPHYDGFILGDLGVFPCIGGWAVWEKVEGEWREVDPFLSAGLQGVTHTKGAFEPFYFWERTRDETIAEAKRMAVKWLREQT